MWHSKLSEATKSSWRKLSKALVEGEKRGEFSVERRRALGKGTRETAEEPVQARQPAPSGAGKAVSDQAFQAPPRYVFRVPQLLMLKLHHYRPTSGRPSGACEGYLFLAGENAQFKEPWFYLCADFGDPFRVSATRDGSEILKLRFRCRNEKPWKVSAHEVSRSNSICLHQSSSSNVP